MLVMIDNYDSFTYNLVQYFGQLGEEVRVFRNDQIDLAGLEASRPSRLVISPGPCSPNEAGISVAAIRHFAGKIPILGVCLGHQAIGAAFGGNVIRAPRLMHGKTSLIYHDGKDLFTACRRLLRPPVTIPSSWNGRACPRPWRCRPKPRWGRSWGCVTGTWRCMGSNSTPSQSLPPRASAYCAIFSSAAAGEGWGEWMKR